MNNSIQMSSQELLYGACLAHYWLTMAKGKGDPEIIKVYERILAGVLDNYEKAIIREQGDLK